MAHTLTAQYICAITHELIVDPVVAEDGQIYERASITRWLRSSNKSPRTNMPMGKRLVPSQATKQTIATLVSSGHLEPSVAAAWHLAKGRLQMAWQLSGGEDGAMQSFTTAEELGSVDAGVLREGLQLKMKVEAQLSKFYEHAQESGVDIACLGLSKTCKNIPGSTKAKIIDLGKMYGAKCGDPSAWPREVILPML